MPEEKKEEKKASEIEETNDGGVAVSLEEEKSAEGTVQGEEEKAEKKPVKQDPLTNKVYAHDRILSNVQKSIEELKNIMLSNASSSDRLTEKQEADLDEIDKLAQKDWKAAVNKLVESKTREMIQADKSQIEQEKNYQLSAQSMEKNSQFVLQRHPELEDTTGEKSQIFQSVLEGNPQWKTSPDGPLLTMYQMEDELRKRGYDIDGTIKNRVEMEKARLMAASASGLPTSRTAVSNNKIVLNREQKDFCDQNGVSYEDYARTLKKSGDKGGIEI